ncbi:hypothetical protein BaRGS_00014162, partial [Batillaria attramentaria]
MQLFCFFRELVTENVLFMTSAANGDDNLFHASSFGGEETDGWKGCPCVCLVKVGAQRKE